MFKLFFRPGRRWRRPGEIEAWWIPYLFRPYPERAVRYQKMFVNTHSFLPPRNDIVPSTAHVLLHLATATMLLDC